MKKDEIRKVLLERQTSLEPRSAGRIAQILRQQRRYRQAKAVFVSPSPLLAQVRMNCLADGKALLCPTAGLKDGFVLLQPYSVAFARISYAATAKGMREFGNIVSRAEELDGISFPLLVDDCVALDVAGLMIGDGNGFFDLSRAIFSAWGKLEDEAMVITVVARQNILEMMVEVEPWDSFADQAITEEGVIDFDRGGKIVEKPAIFWQALTKKRIRKISPLWKLFDGRTSTG